MLSFMEKKNDLGDGKGIRRLEIRVSVWFSCFNIFLFFFHNPCK